MQVQNRDKYPKMVEYLIKKIIVAKLSRHDHIEYNANIGFAAFISPILRQSGYTVTLKSHDKRSCLVLNIAWGLTTNKEVVH